MRIPIYDSYECPNCGEFANITMINIGYIWLADARWICPFCRNRTTTQEMHELKDKREENDTSTKTS